MGMRRTISDVKAKADASARKVAAHKADLQKLQKAEAKLKAQTMARLAHIKTKVAEAEAKKASAEEAVKQLHTTIAEVKDDISHRKKSITKLGSKIFSQQKEADALKKKT